MSYPVIQLITNSWYLSGICSRNLQTVTGDQLSDGLQLLNELLAENSANTRLIPYFQEYNFNSVVGQEMYFIPNLVSVETLTFYVSTVRYSMLPLKRIEYWGTGRVDNINSLPYQYNVQRTLGGCNIYIYFFPNVNYPMVLWGKFALQQVTLNEDLLTVYDLFYIKYLRYALAREMCAEYNVAMQPQAFEKLNELEQMLTTVDPPDLSMQKMSSLGVPIAFNYAQANLGRGWSI